MPIRAVVTDIEGTTSSLSFVKDVLFPYSRERIEPFVRAHASDPAVANLLNDVRREAGRPLNTEELIAQLITWIDEDRKATSLKALQGLIWEHGFKAGDFRGHVYPDALARLRAWAARGIPLYVFSSGSVKAQKLLFGYSEHGDLTPLFAGYFDTTIGPKKERASYRRIAAAIGLPPSEILFLSDIREELDAARAAGMQTRWLVRDSVQDASADHAQARSFDDIQI